MRLTPKTAEKFATALFKEHLKGKEEEFRLRHCREVQKACLILAENKQLDEKALKIASWLHDIGRIEDSQDHPEKSLELAKRQFKKINETIEDCIVNHLAKDKPKTKEGKLFQFADKIALLSPQLFIESLKDDKDGSINFFSENFARLLDLARNYEFFPAEENNEVKQEAQQ